MALLSSIAAAATAILAKVGVEGVPSNAATAVRSQGPRERRRLRISSEHASGSALPSPLSVRAQARPRASESKV